MVEQTVPMQRRSLWFVAPHSDDVAWSMGSFAAQPHRYERRTLLTLFSFSDFTMFGPDEGETETTARRLGEDARFCAMAGLDFVAGELRDGLRRGYADVPALFTVSDPRTEPAFDAALQKLTQLIPDRDDITLFAPFALGGHVDHLICRDALLAHFRRATILFYEDTPYLYTTSDADIREHAADVLGPGARSWFSVVARREQKREAVALYESQSWDIVLRHFDQSTPRLPDGRFVERFWSTATAETIAALPFAAPLLDAAGVAMGGRRVVEDLDD